MKKSHLFIILLFGLITCNKDEPIIENIETNMDIRKRAATSVFNTEHISDNVYTDIYTHNTMCIDFNNNLFYIKQEYPNRHIYQYTPSNKNTSKILDLDLLFEELVYYTFCIDNNGHILLSTGTTMYKIVPNKSITNIIRGDKLIYSVCAANNGNIFYSQDNDIFKISKTGKISKIDIPEYYNKGGGLFKPKGSFLYSSSYISDNIWPEYRKIGTTTSTIEKFDLSPPYQSMAAASNKSNLYILVNNQIVEMRPNSTNNIIGNIPKYIYDKGNPIELGKPLRLSINSDATIFYIVFDTGKLYKLTLI